MQRILGFSSAQMQRRHLPQALFFQGAGNAGEEQGSVGSTALFAVRGAEGGMRLGGAGTQKDWEGKQGLSHRPGVSRREKGQRTGM